MKAILFAMILAVGAAEEARKEKAAYLRAGGKPECTFTIRRDGETWSIRSVTTRGATQLTVFAQYGKGDRLVNAHVTLKQGEKEATVKATVKNGKAKVQQPGQDAKEYDVVPKVIVTSAPDWTDTFMLARRLDPAKKGKQVVAGLWIHPTRPILQPKLSIEKVGSDVIRHEGKKVQLHRCHIRLRNNSPYVAWVDGSGNLIRLIPLPHKKGAFRGIVRQGFEKSAAGLEPKAKE